MRLINPKKVPESVKAAQCTSIVWQKVFVKQVRFKPRVK